MLKPLVLPAELSQLQDLEAYVKLPSDYPCTKVQTAYQKAALLKAEPFLLKMEKKRGYVVLASVEVELSEDAETLQEAESAELIEEIPENQEALV